MILSAALFVLAQTAAQASPAPAAAAPAQGAAKVAPQLITKANVDADVKALFQKMDANHDGKVDKAEADRFRAAGLAAQQARRQQALAGVFAKLDANKDGMISLQEFQAANAIDIAAAAKAPNPWFQANDIDRNGKVELNEAIAKAERNFEMLDKDKNGVLSAEELNAMRRRSAAR